MSYALITGASSGIGYELASVMARGKHNLILVARSVDKMNALKTRLEATYQIDVRVIGWNLANRGAALDLFEAVRKLNLQVDILVNNAGFGEHGLFAKANPERTSAMIQVNITALTELTRCFLPEMISRGRGQILNVASTAAFQPGPLMSVYYATKAYVLSFSEGLHEELLGTGVSVTALCPGPTHSGFQEAANLKDVPMMSLLKVPSSRTVAEFGYKAMRRGVAVAVEGRLNKVMAATVGFMPRPLVRKLAMRLQQKKQTL